MYNFYTTNEMIIDEIVLCVGWMFILYAGEYMTTRFMTWLITKVKASLANAVMGGICGVSISRCFNACVYDMTDVSCWIAFVMLAAVIITACVRAYLKTLKKYNEKIDKERNLLLPTWTKF